MPNWCECELDVNGKPEEFIKFKKDVYVERDKDTKEPTELSFQKIKPMPEEIKDDWYDWSIANWGTKWDACDVTFLVKGYKRITYYFQTAWAPPEPVIIRASELYPELEFVLRYWECGVGFSGWVKYKNGSILESKFNNNYRGSRGG